MALCHVMVWNILFVFKKYLLPFLIPSISDLDKVCTSVAEVTKDIDDCKQQASLVVSNSIEKMGGCLTDKLFLHIRKDAAHKTFCAKPINVINKLSECKMSSNSINEFNNCLIKSVVTLFKELYPKNDHYFKNISVKVESGLKCGGYYVFAKICTKNGTICCEEQIVPDPNSGFSRGTEINSEFSGDCMSFPIEINQDLILSGWNDDSVSFSVFISIYWFVINF